ncbi:MAG: hypothetical protein ACKVZJ_15325 [Phycisphaerales bacterium]
MRTILSKLIGVAAALGCTLGASAQPLPNPVPLPFPSFKWDQRYTPPRATFTSRVVTCTTPQPSPVVAMDDWLCTKPGPILRVTWWGWLSNPTQAQRPFYIAIYRENPNNPCQPNVQPIYQACVTPDQIKLVAQNCEPNATGAIGLPIYALSAKIPPFIQDGTPTNPQHYFLQVSEIDAQSIRPQLEDFRWAGRRPIQVCPALQRGAGGGIVQPLRDICDQKEDDLSFRLHSRALTVTTNPNVPIPSGSVTLSLHPIGSSGQDGVPLESISLNFTKIEVSFTPLDDNRHSVDFDSPDGDYILEVRVPGALPQRRPVTLQEGTETEVASFFDVFFGDLDGNGAINTQDLTQFLANFGRASQ